MASKKDYRLSPAERPFLEQNIPPSQKRIHLSFHADFHIGKKKHSNAIIGLTEHFIIPIAKGFFSGMKVQQLYHIADINEVDVTKADEVDIKFHNNLPPIKIHSTAVIHFVRSLIRNYVLGLPLLPPHKRFIFHSYDMSKFPLFKPRLSPSQLFQLQYNTMCSYLRTSFFNYIALYYYSLLFYGNPIFNANDLPVYFTDPKFGFSFSLDPVVKALSYCPFTHVFSANSIKSPNLIHHAAKLATSNKSCKAIRIRNCGCTFGGKAFLEEFTNTDHDYPIYYDFSGNKLNDFPDLFKAFELITSPVETLNFEDCNMNEESILALFNAINENENLWDISELLIAGNYLNENCIGMLINLMNEFQNSEIYNINTLSFGPAENIEKLTMMIDCCNQPFQHLRIYGTKITPDSTYDLCRYFNRSDTLKNVEFIDCDFEDDNFEQILHTLTENKNITHLSLNLSNCKLSGTKFTIFMKEISNGLGSKLYNLSLDRNKLTLADLTLFNNSYEKFPVLSSLELNGNFNSILGMEEQISRLLRFPKLESLSLNGLGISTLKTDLNKLITELKNNTTIKHIDISKNLVGESGYRHFVDLIKANTTLITAKFSSSEMKNPADVFEILEIVTHHKSLCNTCLFREDVMRLLSNQPPQNLYKYSKLLLSAQNKNMENYASIGAVPSEFEFAQTSLSSVTAASISSLFQLGGAGIGGGGVSTGCPSIDDQEPFLAGILDDSIYELNKMLEFVKPPKNQHLKMINTLFGIPFPFVQEHQAEPPMFHSDLDNIRDGFIQDSNSNQNQQNQTMNHNSLYVISSLFGLIVDNSKGNPSEDTILCKSVLNRRPNLPNELNNYDPSKILVQPSIKHKTEEEEEASSQPPNAQYNKNNDQEDNTTAQDKSSAKKRIRPEKPEYQNQEINLNDIDENELEDIQNTDDNLMKNQHQIDQKQEKTTEVKIDQIDINQIEQPNEKLTERSAEINPQQNDEQSVDNQTEKQHEQNVAEQQQVQQIEKQNEQPQTELPVVEKQPEQPVEQQKQENPEEQISVQQVAEQLQEQPQENPTEHSSVQPVAEQPQEQPPEQPAEQISVQPVAEKPQEQPAIEQSPEQPQEQSITEQPTEHSSEQPTTEQPQEQISVQPVAEQPQEQPALEQLPEQPQEQSVTEQPQENPDAEQPTEQTSEQPTTEQPQEQPPEQPTEQISVQPVAEQPHEQPAVEQSLEQPQEQSVTEQPQEQSVTEQPQEQPPENISVQPVDEQPNVEQSPEQPSEQTSEQPTTEQSQENQDAEQPTEQQQEQPAVEQQAVQPAEQPPEQQFERPVE